MNRQNKSDSAYYYIKLSVKYMDSFRVEGNKLNAKMALFNIKLIWKWQKMRLMRSKSFH